MTSLRMCVFVCVTMLAPVAACGVSDDGDNPMGSDGGGALGGADGSGGSSNVGGTGATGNGGSGNASTAGTSGAGATGGAAASGPIGWASVDADGQNGTYGGRDGEVVEVTSLQELTNNLSDSSPRVVRVSGQIDSTAPVSVGSNKTLLGTPGAVVSGGLRIADQQNIIIQNIAIRGLGCSSSATQTQCSQGEDAVTVRNSHHVWFDHVDVSDGTDGNLDITTGSSYITVSWSKFSYSTNNRQHRFSNLIGGSDTDPADVGRLNVTWHHNWWAQNVDQRMPRTRRGQIHVFNNLYTVTGNLYCINAGFEATLLVENNIFDGVTSPHTVSSGGNLDANDGNLYLSSSGSRDTTGVGFSPPYPYTLDATDGLAARIMAEAGPQ